MLFIRWLCEVNPKHLGNVSSGLLGYVSYISHSTNSLLMVKSPSQIVSHLVQFNIRSPFCMSQVHTSAPALWTIQEQTTTKVYLEAQVGLQNQGLPFLLLHHPTLGVQFLLGNLADLWDLTDGDRYDWSIFFTWHKPNLEVHWFNLKVGKNMVSAKLLDSRRKWKTFSSDFKRQNHISVKCAPVHKKNLMGGQKCKMRLSNTWSYKWKKITE